MKSIIVLISFITAVSAFSKPIEGGTDEARNGNAELLKGVIKLIINSRYLCTGSWIRQDTILTAKHCVESIDNVTQASISANGTTLELTAIKKSETTDIAVIQFKNTVAFGKEPLTVEMQKRDPYTVGRVLVAGYGKTCQSCGAGVLNAGYNTVVESNSLMTYMMNLLVKNGTDGRWMPNADDWHLMGAREEVYSNQFDIGQNIAVEDRTDSTKIPDTQAATMSGDSGGPTFAFQNGKASIIAVTANGMETFFGSFISKVTLKETATGETKVIELDFSTISGSKKVYQAVNDAIEAAGFVKSSEDKKEYIALKAFSVVYEGTRYKYSELTSTTNETNSKFLREALAK